MKDRDKLWLLAGLGLIAFLFISNSSMFSILPSSISFNGVTLRNGNPVMVVSGYLLKGSKGENSLNFGDKLKDNQGNEYVVEGNRITISGELKDAWDEIPISIETSRKIRLIAQPRIVNSLNSNCDSTSPTGKSMTVNSASVYLINPLITAMELAFGQYANNYKCNALAPWDVCCYDYADIGYIGYYSTRPTTKFSYDFNINGKDISSSIFGEKATTSMQNLYHDNNIDIYAVEPPASSQVQGSIGSQFTSRFIPVYIKSNDKAIADWIGTKYNPDSTYEIYYLQKDKLKLLEDSTPSDKKSEFDIYGPRAKFIAYKLNDYFLKSLYDFDVKTESSFTKVFYPSPYLKVTMYINASYLNIKLSGGKPKINNILVYPSHPVGGSTIKVSISASNTGSSSGKFKFDVSCSGASSTPVTIDVGPGESTSQIVYLKLPDISSQKTLSCSAIVTDFVTGSKDTYDFDINSRPTCTEEDKISQEKNIKITEYSGWVWDSDLCIWTCKLTPNDKYDVDELSCSYVLKGTSGYEKSCVDGMNLVSGKCLCPSGTQLSSQTGKCEKIENEPKPVPPSKPINLTMLLLVGGALIVSYMVYKHMKNKK